MKLTFSILFLGFVACLYAQDSIKDTTLTSNENLYIIDRKNQFNVKFDVSNDIIHYNLPNEGIKLSIRPNLNLKYAFVLSYKFLSVRIGFRPPLSEEDKENKGDSNTFRLRFQLLFENWSHLFEYNYDKGYYIVNTTDFDPNIQDDSFFIQFPNLTSNVLFGSSAYKFNKNYSVKAIQSHTEIQIKSAGTFMPSVNYALFSIKGLDEIKFPNDELIERENYNSSKGFNLGLNAGYYYTFVFHKYWYANAYLSPGIGIDFYKITSYTPDETITSNFNENFYSLHSGIGIGYNGEKLFFGGEFSNKRTSEKLSKGNIQIKASKDIFHVFIGYRFKAPKSVKGTLDYIEKKVPILDDND